MISYDNYKNRIEKLAKAKRVAHKFRFLIAGVAVLLVGGSVGLMCAKGAYMSDMAISAQTVEFNSKYEVTPAKAFLAPTSSQHVEYCVSGTDEWTAEKPVKAGKYLARTVSPKLVGYSYSQPVEFEITPIAASFEITGDSVEYGGVPDCGVSGLVSGHRIDKTSLKFEYADYGAARTEVNAVQSTLKIVDASGEDFTSCYNITFSGKQLDVSSRKINVKAEGGTFVYNGAAQTLQANAEQSTLSNLAYGDEITVQTSLYYNGSPVSQAVNAGEYEVRVTSFTVMHGNIDVTARYAPSYLTSSLKIDRREVTVNTPDGRKVFDGKKLENGAVEVLNLVGGHTYEADGELPYLINYGTRANNIKLNFFDADGKNVTDNYRQTLNAGTLEVEKRTVTVSTGSFEAEYSGSPVSGYFDYAFTLSGNPDGFEFNPETETSASRGVDVGEYENKFGLNVTYGGSGEIDGIPVKDNFNIIFNAGKITVKQRALSITTGDGTKIYDGNPVEFARPEYIGAVSGHTLEVSAPCNVINVTAAVGVPNTVKYAVKDGYGYDVTKNYAITYKNGTLKVTARRISVTTCDDSKEYDGIALSNADYTAEWLDGVGAALIGEDKLTVTKFTEITEATSTDNVCAYTLPTFDGINSNYEIVGAINYGTLTVKKKKVVVTVNDATAVYGEKIPDNGFKLDCTALPNGESLSFDTGIKKGTEDVKPTEWEGYTLLDVGNEYRLAVVGATIKITGGNASAANYDFTFLRGKLEITQRVIYYSTEDDEKVYDGTALQNTGYETYYAADNTKKGLLNGDTLTVRDNPTSIVGVEERPNANYFNLPNGNYSIDQTTSTANFGTLKITPRPIIVTTADDSKIYDGDPLSNEGYTAEFAVQNETTKEWTADNTQVGLVTVDGVTDTLTLVGTAVSITDAGEVKNANKFQNPNYNVVGYKNGTLKITKKRVDIKIFDRTHRYGDDDQYAPSRYLFNLGFGRKDGLQDTVLTGNYVLSVIPGFKKDGKILNKYNGSDWEWRLSVGTYSIYPVEYGVDKVKEVTGGTSYTPVDSDMLKNYEIYCDEGKLTISPRITNVTIKDGSAKYGEDVSEKDYGFDIKFPYSGLTELPYGEQLTLTYKYDRDVTDVGEYDIFEDKVFIDGIEIDRDNCNYKFTFNKGKLTVEQADLKVYVYNHDESEPIDYGDLWSYKTGKGNYASAEGLIDGEELEITVEVALINSSGKIYDFDPDTGKYRLGAGSYAVNMTGGKIYVDGAEKEDGFGNYKFTFESGNLAVAKKSLQVTFTDEDNQVEYGDDLKDFTPAYTTNLDGNMPYGETFAIGGFTYLSDGAEAPVKKNAGKYDINGKDCVFTDKEGVSLPDGGNNYEITYKGVLTVNKKKVSIKFKDDKLKYGFEYLLQGLATFETYFVRTDGSTDPVLAYGEVLYISMGYKKDGEVLNRQSDYKWHLSVGKYSRYALEYKVYESEESSSYIDSGETLQNYEITCGEGEVEITPYTVTVKPNDNTCVYGTPEEEIENTYEYTDGWTVAYGMPYGEDLILSYSYDPSPLKDVGDYKIIGKAMGVTGGDLKNYDVSYEEGVLTVTQRTVNIELEEKTLVYGNTVPTAADFNLILNGETVHNGTLWHDETLTVSVIYYKKDGQQTDPKNVGEYGVVADSFIIKDNNGNVVDEGAADGLKNYIIVCKDGKLNISQREITVVLNPITAPITYGEQFAYATGEGNYANSPDLAPDETLEIAVKYLEDLGFGETEAVEGLPVNAGLYVARIDYENCVFYDKDGNPIKDGYKNYLINCDELDNLRIERRVITVKALSFTGDDAVTYGDLGVNFNYPDDEGNYEEVSGLQEDNYGDTLIIKVRYTLYGTTMKAKHLPVMSVPYDIEILSEFTIYNGVDGTTEQGDGVTRNYRLDVLHSTKGKLEIVKRKVTVDLLDLGQIIYGQFDKDKDNPTYPFVAGNYVTEPAPDLASGEQLKVTVSYIDEFGTSGVIPRNVGKYEIDGAKFTVYNEDGELVGGEGNYEIEWGKGALEITQREVAFSVSVPSAVYGDEIQEPTIYLAGINPTDNDFVPPYNEKITADFVYEVNPASKRYTYGKYTPQNEVTPKNVGTYYALPKTIYVDGAENGVSNYLFLVTCGSLVITPRDLYIELKPIDNVTYGDTFTYASGKGNYTNVPDFGYEEELEAAVLYQQLGKEVTPKDAGEYTATLDVFNSVFYDKDGNVIEDGRLNYKISCNALDVEIYRLKVTVVAEDKTCVYGTDTASGVEYTSKVTIDGVTVTVTDEIELVYEEIAALTYVRRLSSSNDAVVTAIDCGLYGISASVDESFNKNYDFDFTDGTLKITQKTLNIKVGDEGVEYGDLPLSYRREGDVPVFATQRLAINEVEYYDKSGNPVERPKNVGAYTVKAVGFILYDYASTERPVESGAGDEFKNYIIVCEDGKLTVSKRSLTVTVNNNGWTYGDAPVTNNSFSTDLEDGMPYNEKFVLTYAYEPEKPVNAGSYPIKGTVTGVNDENGVSIDGGLDNYDIVNVADGELAILPKAITVNIKDTSAVYGETPDVKYTVEGMIGDETLKLTFRFSGAGEVPNVGTYAIVVASRTVEGGNGKVDNYEIDYENASPRLTVTAKPVTVTITGDKYVYFDKESPDTSFDLNCELPNGESFELTYGYLKDGANEKTSTPVAAGIYAISAEYAVKGGNASADNYSVKYEYDTQLPDLVIERKQITVQLNDNGLQPFEYGDDYEAVLSEVQIPVGDMVDGQILKVKIDYSAVNSARSRAMSRALGARANALIPKDAGDYIAVLNFGSSKVYESDGVTETDGGIENYALADGFTPDEVKFTIAPKKVNVTIDDASITYGENLPADKDINYSPIDLVGDEKLKLTFSYGDGTNPVKNKGFYSINVATEEIEGGKLSNYEIKYNSATLEIEARELTIDVLNKLHPFGTEFAYPDSVDNCTAHNAADGEYIKITVKFVYKDGTEVEKPYNAGTYAIIMTDFAVYDESGNLIDGGKDNYTLSADGKDGELVIDSAVIVVKTIGNSKEYDGKPITNLGYEVEGTLVGGDRVVMDGDLWAEQIDVTPVTGVTDNTAFKIVDKDGYPSNNYDLSVEGGKLIITKKPITIKTDTAWQYYNGKKFTKPFDKTTVQLADGDEFVIEEVAEITNAGNTENFVKYKIISNARDGKTVTDNYETTDTTFGTLTVRSLVVNIGLPFVSNLPYGEKPDAQPAFDKELPNGEKVTFDIYYTRNGVETLISDGSDFLLDVGSYRTRIDTTSFKISGGTDNKNVTPDNYDFSGFTRGRVDVVAREITVTTKDGTHVYDGTKFSYAEYDTAYAADETKAGLLNGDKLTVLSVTEVIDVTENPVPNVCEYDVPNDNYKIVKVNDGKLTVTKKDITVTTGSILDGVYNGAAHSTDKAEAAGDLVEGHKLLAVLPLFGQTDATGKDGVDNTTEFIVVDGEGNDVTKNYNISYEYGKIIVSPAEITVKTGSITDGVYNGDYYYTTDGALIGGTLYNGAQIVADSDNLCKVLDATDANGVDNDTLFKVVDGEGKDVSKNYKINYYYGKIIVSPADVTVSLVTGVEDVYGNLGYGAKLTLNAVNGLVNDEKVNLALEYRFGGATVANPENAGEYVAAVDWNSSTVTRKDGTAGKISNYNLTVTPATVTFKITQKAVTVKLNENVEVVYGEEYSEKLTQNAVSGTVGTEKLSLALNFTDIDGKPVDDPKNAGTYTAVTDWNNCTVTGGLLSNYKLSDESAGAEFTIKPKSLGFTMQDLEVNYGEEVKYPTGAGNYDGEATGLLSGEYLEVVAAYKNKTTGETVENPQFAGEYDIVCSGIIIRDAGGVQIVGGESNYSYENAESGTLTIKGTNVTVTLNTVKKYYDGTALTFTGEGDEVSVKYMTAEGEKTELPAGYTLKIIKGCSTDGADVQSIDNTAEFAVYKGEELSGEYIVQIEKDEEGGKLIIEARPVKIKTLDASKEYDGDKLTAGYDYADDNIYELLTGHTFSVVSQAEITDVGEEDNEYVFKVLNGETDVTGNYDIKITECGTLKITEFEITVTIGDFSTVYGEDIDGVGFEKDRELISGMLSFDTYIAQKDDASKTPIEIQRDDNGYVLLNKGSYAIVADEDSVSVVGGKASNYKFTFTDGTLTVSARKISVVTTDNEKEYDGTMLNVGGYDTYLYGNDELAGLIGGDELTVDETELATKGIINVKDEMSNEFTFSLPAGGNYELGEVTYGTMTVTPRAITVKTGDVGVDKVVVYDGNEHFNKVGSVVSGTLVGDHKLVVDEDTVLKLINATEGEDNTTEFKIFDGTTYVTDNYAIEYEYGTIVIAPAKLTVTINATEDKKVSFEYGDTTLESSMETFTAEGLVGDDELTVAIGYDIGELPVAVGGYTAYLDVDNCVVVTNNGTDIENGIGNYDIECEDVEFTITKRAVKLTLGDNPEKEYDGNFFDYEADNCVPAEGYGFAYDETIDSLYVEYYDKDGNITDPLNAGEYTVKIDLDMTFMSDEYNSCITENYEIECDPITLTVNKREINVILSDVEHTYDGAAFDFDSAEEGFEVKNMVEGEELTCTVTYVEGDPVNVGTYTVNFDGDNLTMANGDAATNYKLAASGNILTCQLKINKRSIEVEVADRIEQQKTLDEVLTNVYGVDDLTSYLADGSDGFGFADKDLNGLGAKFALSELQDADEVSGAAAYKITVTFTGETVAKNYEVSVIDGTLLLTDKWISVTPTVNGEFTYDGNPVDIGAFDIEHIHMPDGSKNSGFTDSELAMLEIEYVFTNLDDETDVYSGGLTPVNAGDYEVTVVLHVKSGNEEYFKNYLIEVYSEAFTIAKRTVNVKTLNDGGETEFVYSNTEPDVKATIDLSGNAANEGFIGATPAYSFVNIINGADAERYNVGTYQVDVRFEDSDNYDIVVTEYFEFEITKRTVVLKPTHPDGGNKIPYAGEALRLGETDFEEAYGTHAQDDVITITSTAVEPTRLSGTVQINGVTVKDKFTNEDVTDNYEFIYDRAGAVKYLPQATIADFRVVLEYEKMTFEYEQVVNGKTFEYDGSTHRYEFEGTADQVVKVLNNSLYTGHTLTLRANYYTAAAAAGTTSGWLNGIIRIKDANNKDVTALYDFDCQNATDEGKPVIVEKVKVTVTISGISASGITERVTKLTSANYSTSELAEDVGVEVYAYNIRGQKSLGVTVFKTKNGSRTDLSANYEITIVNNTDIAKAEVLSLADADKLALPALDITFLTNITAADLDEGDLFFLDTDGVWKLNASCYKADGLEDGHKVEIVVTNDGGAWSLGVAVTGENSSGNKIDVKSKYNLGQLQQFGDVSVAYVSLSEMNSARKLLYIDFTGAFTDNHDGTYSVNEALIANGKLDASGFTYTGLKANDNQVVEVSVSDDGNGNYTFTVRVYKENKVAGRVVKIDQYKNYTVVSGIPAGAPATAVFATL